MIIIIVSALRLRIIVQLAESKPQSNLTQSSLLTRIMFLMLLPPLATHLE